MPPHMGCDLVGMMLILAAFKASRGLLAEMQVQKGAGIAGIITAVSLWNMQFTTTISMGSRALAAFPFTLSNSSSVP